MKRWPLFESLLRPGLSPWQLVAVPVAVAWIPLLLLTAAAGTLGGPIGSHPFIRDANAQVRLLAVLPLYIAFAWYIDPELQNIIAEFTRRDIIREHRRYWAIVSSMDRMLNRRAIDVAILVVAFVRSMASVFLEPGSSWLKRGPGLELTAAGWWYALVALPILFYISGRWLWTILVWSTYLVRTARLNLKLIATHPDGVGGLGFIGLGHSRFAALAFAAGVAFSARIAVAIISRGHQLPQYTVAIVSIALGQLVFIVAPLLAFTPALLRMHRLGKQTYGRLGTEYVQDFETKWIRQRQPNDVLIGAADIQSLADLASSYEVVAQSRSLVLSRRELMKVAALTIAPYLPLLLTMMSVSALFKLVTSVIR